MSNCYHIVIIEHSKRRQNHHRSERFKDEIKRKIKKKKLAEVDIKSKRNIRKRLN